VGTVFWATGILDGKPQIVKIPSAKLDSDELSPGSIKQAAFTVRNIDDPRTFKITVTDAHQFVSKVEPKELTLGARKSGTVRVDLTVPVGTRPGLGDDLVIVAASTGGPTPVLFTFRFPPLALVRILVELVSF